MEQIVEDALPVRSDEHVERDADHGGLSGRSSERDDEVGGGADVHRRLEAAGVGHGDRRAVDLQGRIGIGDAAVDDRGTVGDRHRADGQGRSRKSGSSAAADLERGGHERGRDRDAKCCEDGHRFLLRWGRVVSSSTKPAGADSNGGFGSSLERVVRERRRRERREGGYFLEVTACLRSRRGLTPQAAPSRRPRACSKHIRRTSCLLPAPPSIRRRRRGRAADDVPLRAPCAAAWRRARVRGCVAHGDREERVLHAAANARASWPGSGRRRARSDRAGRARAGGGGAPGRAARGAGRASGEPAECDRDARVAGSRRGGDSRASRADADRDERAPDPRPPLARARAHDGGAPALRAQPRPLLDLVRTQLRALLGGAGRRLQWASSLRASPSEACVVERSVAPSAPRTRRPAAANTSPQVRADRPALAAGAASPEVTPATAATAVPAAPLAPLRLGTTPEGTAGPAATRDAQTSTPRAEPASSPATPATSAEERQPRARRRSPKDCRACAASIPDPAGRCARGATGDRDSRAPRAPGDCPRPRCRRRRHQKAPAAAEPSLRRFPAGCGGHPWRSR